jgi:hypothetical protein
MKNKKTLAIQITTVFKMLLSRHFLQQYNFVTLRSTFYTFIVAVTIMLSSCEKIIEVNFDEAAQKYVLEGNVTNIAGLPAEVKISQTKNLKTIIILTALVEQQFPYRLIMPPFIIYQK